MNWTVEKLETESFVRVAATGIFDPDEHLTMLEDLLTRRFWKPETPALFDFRDVEFGETNLDDVRQASLNRQQNDARFGCGKSAFLMKSLTDFARGRQFQLLTEDKVCSTLRIFMDEEQSTQWLRSATPSEEFS